MAFAILCVAVFVLVLLSGSVLGFEFYYADRIYPGVTVWGADVGGLRPREPAPGFEEAVTPEALVVSFSGAGLQRRARFTDLGLILDAEATLQRAYQHGRGPSRLWDVVTHIRLLAYGQDLAPVYVFDESLAQAYVEVLAAELYRPATDASLNFDGVTPVTTAAAPGRALDTEGTLAALSSAISQLAPTSIELVVREIEPTITDAEPARAAAEALLASPLTLILAEPRENDPGPWVLAPEQLVEMLGVAADGETLQVSVDEGALRAHLEVLAPELATEPIDARFHFNDATNQLEAISASQNGRELDVEASVANIVRELSAGNHHVPLTTKAVSPAYPDTARAEEIGIVELVAEGDSYFIGSPRGRDHNIRLAATKFDGIIVPPGETFSFNHFLGEVSAEAGYDESYITAGEQLAVEVGGGICQVSTTAFRAAFWGGYPIVERWPHNNRIGYYELRDAGVGMDATVYSPYVDLKFTNDREYPLLIETEVEEAEHRLVFRFYSTDDGRQVEKDDAEVTNQTEPGPPIYELDEELEEGTVIKWQSAVDGLTAIVSRRVLNAAGKLIIDDSFVSRYDPRRAAYHYGPGYVPSGEED
jgi:vancomycin resistance protein YoaR